MNLPESEILDREWLLAQQRGDLAEASSIQKRIEAIRPKSIAPPVPKRAPADGKTWRDIGDGWEELRAPGGPVSSRRIRGIATSKTVTSNKTASLPPGMEAVLPLPLRADHETAGRGIGHVVLLRRNAEIVYFEAILDDHAAADFGWSKIIDRHFRSVSIGRAPNQRVLAKVAGATFLDCWTLREISVVKDGANPDARFEVMHGDGDDWLEYVRTPRPAVTKDAPALPYKGVWSADTLYGAGQFVTDKGALWCAKRANVGSRPGEDHDAWQLAVKSGQTRKLKVQP